MGQFDSYLQRGFRPPTIAMRVISVLIVVGFTAQAIKQPTLETILTAALFLLLIVPDLIAPRRYRAWLANLERDHPILGNLLVVVIVGGGGFLALRLFLDRTPSALIAAALAVIAVVATAIVRRRRVSPSGRVD